MRIAMAAAVLLTFLASAGVRAADHDPKPIWDVPFVTAIEFAAAPGMLLETSGSDGFQTVDAKLLASRPGEKPGILMTFAKSPADPRVRYASGYAGKDAKLGFLESTDGGRVWRKISDGAASAVAFHAIAVANTSPPTIYGFEGAAGLMVSRDGGATWRVAGGVPAEVLSLAVPGDKPRDLIAATRAGLFRSRDDGATWARLHPAPAPATAVEALPGGRFVAFVYGVGLVESGDDGANWRVVAAEFEDRALMSLAVDPARPRQMYASADTGAVVTSSDGGRSWLGVEGHGDQTPARVAAGRKVYQENCQVCHGENGIGERPDDMYAQDENGQFVAPPLDDSAHGWHHSDAQLADSIVNGSPRNPRMIAWKESLKAEDVRNVIAYIKSLWSFSSWACQGQRHMRCM